MLTEEDVVPTTMAAHRRIFHIAFSAHSDPEKVPKGVAIDQTGQFLIETNALTSLADALRFKDDCVEEARALAKDPCASVIITSMTRIDR